MRHIYHFFTILILSLITLTTPSAKDGSLPKLTIYTYSGFAGPYGVGPKAKAEFEKTCNCEVVFTSPGHSLDILNKIKLEGKNTRADIAMGLDNNVIHEATKTGLFVKHNLKTPKYSIAVDFNDDIFIPFDYSYFAFLYDKDKIKKVPTSMDDFINNFPDANFIMSDPRVSTPGLGLVLWMKDLYGDKAPEMWKKLKPRLVTVAPSWGTSYNLFLKGQSDYVLAYTTSPPANLFYNKKDNHDVLIFNDGNYVQLEVAALTVKGDKNPLARQFLEFMLSPRFQNIIPEVNWMWPSVTPKDKLPIFKDVKEPKKVLMIPSEEVSKNRQKWVNEWINALYN
ncbi:thiamine ABC transporter substrate binding subunit [Bartonella sp. DGB1]|uniref:thiamine ABC transporter substrate-binding protein n=1 Tax=Bartonella sp. DGB1 TaxID=3239807 RepID=UPI003526033E